MEVKMKNATEAKPMEYPKTFVEKVKKEFPNWKEMHKHLDAGSSFVGRYLDDSSNFEMSAEAIVKAFNEGREQEVKKHAEEVLRKQKLYSEWGKLYDAYLKDIRG
jgi:hypothetical protein